MRRLSKFSCGFAFAAAAFILVSPKSTAQDEPAVFRTSTNQVTVHVSVLDKNGKIAAYLPQTAFKLFEDNIEQPLKFFKQEDVPVSMAILIDNSGSMQDKRSKVAAAALALVKASNPDDEVFIENFNDDAAIVQDFTNDIDKMDKALEKIEAHGGTAMRNAISMAIDHLRERGKHDKKVIVVVTDGNDNASTETSLDQLVRKVQNSDGVLIYSIGLLDEEVPREAKAAKKALKALAEASGGLDYYPKDIAEIENITPDIAHEIRNQYTLAYTPTNPALDGTFRALHVIVRGYTNVRSKNGYYAKPSLGVTSSSVIGRE